MATAKELTRELQEVRGNIEKMSRAVDSLSKRVEDVMTELARIKEAQNEVLAGLALWERGRRLKDDLGLEQEPSGHEESPWDEIQAYCRNCMRVTHIREPSAVFDDGRTTIRAKCRNCGTMVIKTLV